MKILGLAVLLSAFAMAGQEGGGGGGICSPRSCITLAEAGLRINSHMTNEFKIGMEQKNDLYQLIELIPVDFDKKILYRSAIGDSKTFKVVEAQDKNKFEKFKQEYLSILSSVGMDAKDFKLLAATKKTTTYILPEYEQLNTRSKSYVLIHEALIRNYGASVKEAIRFESEILDYIKLAQENMAHSFDASTLQSLVVDLKMGKQHFVNEYNIIYGNDHRYFLDKSPEYIESFFKQSLSASLYADCVMETKNQKLCELMPETYEQWVLKNIIYEGNVHSNLKASMMMKYLKSDARSKNMVHVAYTGYLLYPKEKSYVDVYADLKIRTEKKAMNLCIHEAKDPSLCTIMDKTFEVYVGYVVLSEGVAKKEYNGRILVIEKKR